MQLRKGLIDKLVGHTWPLRNFFFLLNFKILHSAANSISKSNSIHLRKGACMQALQNSSSDVKKNFLAGHSCGDELDLDENGRPQMALRISFGYHNSREDVEKLVSFFADFIRNSTLSRYGKGITVTFAYVSNLKIRFANFHKKIILLGLKLYRK